MERVDAGREEVFGGGWPEWSPFVELFGPDSAFCRGLGCDFAESRLMDEANQFHIYCIPPMMGVLPFGQQERIRCTQEELDEDHQNLVQELRPKQRAFEDHHGAEGCGPEGLVLWPEWALEQMRKMRDV